MDLDPIGDILTNLYKAEDLMVHVTDDCPLALDGDLIARAQHISDAINDLRTCIKLRYDRE